MTERLTELREALDRWDNYGFVAGSGEAYGDVSEFEPIVAAARKHLALIESPGESDHQAALLQEALERAWTDFGQDIRSAIPPGSTSMAMEWRIEWIGKLSEVIGPISWREVEIDLLRSGWFQRINEQLGFDVPHDRINDWLAQRSTSREDGTSG